MYLEPTPPPGLIDAPHAALRANPALVWPSYVALKARPAAGWFEEPLSEHGGGLGCA